MFTYKTSGGEHISTTARRMAAIAKSRNETVTANFNDIELLAEPGDTAQVIEARFNEESDRRHEKWLASPEYAEQKRKREEAQREKERKLAESIVNAREHMTLRDPEGWKKSVEANTDEYGAAVLRYAEKWARIMEARIAAGETLEQCAENASHVADDEGLTGFMYGCAVAILSQVWVHGEALRTWHNLSTQLGNEGELANETGGVLNPALLNIG